MRFNISIYFNSGVKEILNVSIDGVSSVQCFEEWLCRRDDYIIRINKSFINLRAVNSIEIEEARD